MSSYAQSIFIYVYDHLLDKISNTQTLKSKIGKNLFGKCLYLHSKNFRVVYGKKTVNGERKKNSIKRYCRIGFLKENKMQLTRNQI